MIHDDTPEWQKGLRFFGFHRAHGGLANDGDDLRVRIRCLSQADADAILRSIQERLSEADGRFWTHFNERDGVLIVSFAGANGDPYSISKGDYDRARRMEPAFAHLEEQIIDGPMNAPIEQPPPVLMGGAFGDEVRLLKMVTDDMQRKLEETWREGSPEAQSQVEWMLGSIKQLVREGHLVSISGEQFTHLRTEHDFQLWAARYLTRREKKAPPPVVASPKEEPPAPVVPASVVPAEPPPAPAPVRAKRGPWSGTWDEAREIVAGIPCSRLVLVSTEDGLTGEVWEFLEDGHRPGLVLTRSLSGRFLADGTAYWATMLLPEAPDLFYVDLVQGRFSGDTFQGTAIRMDMDGKVRRKQPLELRRSA